MINKKQKMNDEKVLTSFKKKLVGTLYAFDKFCESNDLDYFVCSGTAIGAIRHKGFIPWDDDIDVYMPRKDYDKLVAVRGKLSNSGYNIVTLGDEGYMYSFAKFYDTNTTLVELKEFPSCSIGVYVDIFPLDETSLNVDELKKKKEKYEKLFHNFQFTYFKPSLRWICGKLCRFQFISLIKDLYYCYSSEEQKNLIRNIFIQYENDWKKDNGNKLFYHHATYALNKELFEKEWFTSFIYVPFEDIKVRICTCYDQYLTRLFGDYLKLPPEKDRLPHHFQYYLNLKEGLTSEQVIERVRNGEFLVI